MEFHNHTHAGGTQSVVVECGEREKSIMSSSATRRRRSDGAEGGGGCVAGLDFSTRTWRDALPNLSSATLGKLHRDCATVYTFVEGSMWLEADAKPRCLLESLALAVFERHTRGVAIDRATAGAEWWVQVRMPSRGAGEGEGEGEDGDDDDPIQFHFDVDEYLQDALRLTVSPTLSTVTYLCDSGAPTCVIEGTRAPPRYKVSAVYGAVPSATFSFPRVGKHLVFDGELLHGAVPVDALPADDGCGGGASPPKAKRATPGRTQQKSSLPPPPPRITLLVNIWLNGHRPTGIEPMLEQLAARLTPAASAKSAIGASVRALANRDGRTRGGDAPSTIAMASNTGASRRDKRKRGASHELHTAFGRSDPPRHALTLRLPAASDSRWVGASDTLVLTYDERAAGYAAIGPSANARGEDESGTASSSDEADEDDGE